MSSAVHLAPDLHRVPQGTVVVSIKICQNCERPFFRCAASTRAHCCLCEAQLGTSGNQLWRCWECGCDRSWGTGQPSETEAKQLRCMRCHHVTKHSFQQVF